MPELPSPGQVVRVEWRVSDNASIDAGSRVFLDYTGGTPDVTSMNLLATNVSEQWGDSLAALTQNSEHLVQVVTTDLSSEDGAQGEWTGSIVGTRGGGELIASAATQVLHEINRRYRGGRPRTYLRAGVETDLEQSNEWTADYQTEALAQWEAFISGVLGTTGYSFQLGNIVNISWYKGFTVYTSPSGRARNIPTLRATPVVDQILSSVVPLKVSSQRRRLDL